MTNEQTLPKENKMGVMPINKLLISMSLPMILSMLVQALYNIVDSMFVSRIGEDALTALSLAFPMQNLMIAVGAGTGVGINALLSRSLGEKNEAEANRSANNGIFLAILSCCVFMLFGFFFSRSFFETQTDEAAIIDYGTTYLSICSIFSIGIFGQVTFERLLQSTGKTFYTMITQGTGAIINIILDPILIFGLFGLPKLGVAGAAYATVIGQVVAAILAIIFNLKVNHEIKLQIKGFRPCAKTIGKIYSVGLPSIIMMSIGSVMTYGFNNILLKVLHSTTAAAVFGAYFKLQSFIFMPVFGLNNGMVPIIAYNYGAKKKDRMIKTIKLSVTYAVSMMIIGLIVFQLFPAKLLSIFDASENMLSIGTVALRIISIHFIFAGFCIIVGSVFQALGNGVLSLIISAARQLVVILPAAYILGTCFGLNAVWFAFPLAEIVSLILSTIFLRHTYKTKIHPLDLPEAEYVQ